jgi:hypothetical protein
MCLGQPAPPDQTQKGHPVESTSVTQPVTKRADQLVVGDRILPHRLPAVASKPGEVLFVQVHEYRTARWVFVAYRLPDGFYDSTAYLPDGTVEVYPEIPADDGEVTQPIAGRAPAEVAGGLVQVDPPRLIVGDTAAEQRDNAYAAYERDEAEGFVPAQRAGQRGGRQPEGSAASPSTRRASRSAATTDTTCPAAQSTPQGTRDGRPVRVLV